MFTALLCIVLIAFGWCCGYVHASLNPRKRHAPPYQPKFSPPRRDDTPLSLRQISSSPSRWATHIKRVAEKSRRGQSE